MVSEMPKDLTGQFARITTDTYVEYGLAKDALVFIAGSGFSPIDDEDNFKLLFIACPVSNNVPQGNGTTIARANLAVCSDTENDTLRKLMEETIVATQEAAKATSN